MVRQTQNKVKTKPSKQRRAPQGRAMDYEWFTVEAWVKGRDSFTHGGMIRIP
jgi:hypothetical protein